MNPDLQSMPDDVTRSLPHAMGPEKSVLSTILKEPREFLPRALELGLTGTKFYLPQHTEIFETLLRLSDGEAEIELVTLIQHLLDTGKLDRCGGAHGVADLYTFAPTPASFDHHARQILDKHILREIIRVAGDAIQNAYDAPGEAQATLDDTEKQILAIRDQAQPQAQETNRDAINQILDDMRALCEGRSAEIGISTGFIDLDAKTSGLKPGQVFVIAARPSMGKTALLMNIAEHMAFTLERPGLIFSCEMTKKELLARLMYSRARFNPATLHEHKPDKGELLRIQRAALDINNSGLHIDDTAAITITALRAKARRAKKRHGIEFIGIDYLQLLRATSRQAEGSREREIAEISAGIKATAKELKIPIILLAQLNRDSEKRTGASRGVPRMSDLRESGAIEQDADLIGLLTRDAYFAETEEQKTECAGRSRLILAKNRSGTTGDVHLTFIPELVRFETGTAPKKDPEPKQKEFDRFGNPRN